MGMFLYFFISMALAQSPVVFKKGMLITCPKNQKPVYSVVETVREGQALTSKDIVFYGTKKSPLKGEAFLCDSVISTWRGVCIHSNQGWLPESCQNGLRIKLEFEPTVE